MDKLLVTPLDVEEYLHKQANLRYLFPLRKNLAIREISLGYVNKLFVIAVQGKKKRSYVLKQTLPYMRYVGSSWPLESSRFNIELHCLLYYNQILPNFSPKIYYYNYDMQIMIMEYLQDYVGLGEHLNSYLLIPNFAEDISTFLSHVLFFTSDYFLTSREKKQLQAELINPSIETISEILVFTNPYMDVAGNKWNPRLTRYITQIKSDGQIKQEIAALKEKFVNSPQALLHGDFHQDSILINSKNIKVIDPEFALWGPIGYDIGVMFCTLIVAYLHSFAELDKKNSRMVKYQEHLLCTIVDIWNGFSKKFSELWTSNNRGHLIPERYWKFQGGVEAFEEYKKNYLLQVLRDSCGFAGCRILAGLMGFITFHNINSIPNIVSRTKIELIALKIGRFLILERSKINNIEELVSAIKIETHTL